MANALKNLFDKMNMRNNGRSPTTVRRMRAEQFVVTLEETVRELEDRLDMTRSEEIEETARMVAFLQD